MDADDPLIQRVFLHWKTLKPGQGSLHPDDESVACFLEGKLPPEDSRKVMEHIISCPECGRALRCHLSAVPPEEPSAELLDKTRKLLFGRLGLHMMELCVRAADQLLEILSTTGDVLVGQELVPAALFRERQAREFRGTLTVLKDFKDLRLELNVEKKAKDLNISAMLRDKESQKPLTGLRVGLCKEGKELESYLAESGSVTFERVQAGKYLIEVTSQDECLACVSLEIAA